MGKPAVAFFEAVLDSMSCKPENAVMVGDDLQNDVGGAQANGIRGILVRTGKYRRADEDDDTIRPHLVVDNIVEAVDKILRDN